MDELPKPPKTISQKALVTIFKDIKQIATHDVRFCFLVGAGASKSSEIPTGWDLSKDWYNDLKDDLDSGLIQSWESEVGTALNIENVGHFYPFLYEKRYEAAPQIGHEAFKKLMEGKEPSIGYVILSQILAYEKHNFVITTNFDYLIEDAVRMHTATKPFTAGHETLAEFISSQTERPTIIKVHRDLFLNPFNDKNSISNLKTEWKNALTPILKNFNLLVIGYGGNDGSLMDYLAEINVAGRKPIYWCKRKEDTLNTKVEKLLGPRDFIVEVQGFDELMYALYGALDFDIFKELDDQDNHPLIKTAKKRIQSLKEKLKGLVPDGTPKAAISEDVKNILEGASKYLADAYLEKDPAKRTLLYEEGIRHYPDDAPLAAGYASYLGSNEKYDEANDYYLKATQLNPDYDTAFNNWGTDLSKKAVTKKGKEKEALYLMAFEKYERAIQITPNHIFALYNWGTDLGELANTKKGSEADALYKSAFEKYEKVLQIDPNHEATFHNWGTNLGNWAKIKTGNERESLFAQAFEKYEKTIQINPENSTAYNNWGNNLGNLARTKTDTEADILFEQACKKYEAAIRLNPGYNTAFNNWGYDLGKWAERKNGPEMETLYSASFEKYERATEINPDDSLVFFNWGFDLGELALKKKGVEADNLYKSALDKYKKATELNTLYDIAFNNWGNCMGNWAKTKTGHERETLLRQSLEKFEKATQINPDNDAAYNNWGNGLGNLAKMKTTPEAEALFEQAFKKYEKAIQINPEDSTTLNNWASDLANLAWLKKGAETEKLFIQSFEKYEKSLQINPYYSTALCNWATDLGNLAFTKTGPEAERLYIQAFEKFEKITEMNPGFEPAFFNWGAALSNFGRTKTEPEATTVYMQALEKLEKTDMSEQNYIRACLYALIKDKKNALKYLKIGLKNGETQANAVTNDPDWGHYANDKDFQKILKQYS